MAPFVIDNFLKVMTLEIHERDKFALVTSVKTMKDCLIIQNVKIFFNLNRLMFPKFVKRHCPEITLHCNHTIVRLINCLRVDSLYELLVKSKSTNFAPIGSFSCEIDFIMLPSDLMLFNHLIRFAVDYENTSSNCSSCNTVLKLND